jgi:hypothetical protein
MEEQMRHRAGAYSGDVNRLFRLDVNKSERSDAGVAMMLEDIHIRQQATDSVRDFI